MNAVAARLLKVTAVAPVKPVPFSVTCVPGGPLVGVKESSVGGVGAGALTLPHDGGEMTWTLIGVGLLALGHDLNRRATA